MTRRNSRRLLAVEHLEPREVPSVTLAAIGDQGIPNDKPIYIPVTVTNTPAGAVTTTVVSDNAGVVASIVTGGRSVEFTVTGTDSGGNPFTGTITLRLFESAAPLATGRMIDLINSGYYTNKLFHRVIDGFMIQGGSPTGNGVGGPNFPNVADEYNPAFTFASGGVLAMANAGDDGNNSQFFITDYDVPLNNRPQSSLNFNHTIFGIMTDGFDTYQKVITVAPLDPASGNPNEISRPRNNVTITAARVFSDVENAVVKLVPTVGFTGTANIEVTSDDETGPTKEMFAVTAADDGSNSRAFLGTIANQTTTTGQPVSFNIPSTDIDGDARTYDIRNVTFNGLPMNMTFTIDQTTGRATLTPAAGFTTGTIQFKVGVRDSIQHFPGQVLNDPSSFDTQLVTLTVTAPPPTVPPPPVVPPVVPPVTPPVTPPPPTSPSFTIEGSDAGAEPRITVRNPDGTTRFNIIPFDMSFTGGVRALMADVTNDGIADIVAVPGFGGGPVMKVYDAATGAELFSIMMFEDSFRGGLRLDLADTANLGYSQVVVSAGETGGPRVTVYDVARRLVLQNYFAGDDGTRGGVTVDVAELRPGTGQQIIAAFGPGAGPLVAVFDADTGNQLGTFFAGDENDRAGVTARAGDLDPATNTRYVVVSPFTSPPGLDEQQIEISRFVNFSL